MPELHYHPVYGWNLVWDLITAKEIKPNQVYPYMHERLAALGPQVNEENQQVSREMLVFADRVLLPGELDVPLPQPIRDAGHIDYWSSASRPLSDERWRLKRQEYMHDRLRLLLPMLLEIQDAHAPVTASDLERLFNYWEECDKWEEDVRQKVSEETWQAIDVMRDSSFTRDFLLSSQSPVTQKSIRALLATDPKRHKEEFSKLEQRVRPLTSLVLEADVLKAHDIPTLFRHRTAFDSAALAALPADMAEKLTGVVGVYFENILVPRPESFSDALKLRDSKEVAEWRTKINEWTALLQASPGKLSDVKMQIEDANNYISIALPKSKVGRVRRLSPWIAWPLGVIGFMTGFAPAELAALSIEGIKLAAKIVTGSIRSPDRLQYRWVMLSAVDAGRSGE